ncbi:hypothetical protein Q8A73_016627 [Channa argus]|nr:hypothetical protein Q8A73_016627 [Channa argus]
MCRMWWIQGVIVVKKSACVCVRAAYNVPSHLSLLRFLQGLTRLNGRTLRLFSASYKELFKPRYRHTEQAFILGQRERGGWGASVTLETRELTDSRAKPATSFSQY